MTEEVLVVLKPDAIERNLVGAILSRFEQDGLKIRELSLRLVTPSFVAKHYPDRMARELGEKSRAAGQAIEDPVAYGMGILEWNRQYLSRGAVVAIVLSGANAISRARKAAGRTDPSTADKGTIRGDFAADSILQANREGRSVNNLVHVSGTVDEASAEIGLWFPTRT